ncbi:chaperonin 10-like protein [Hygrophoropsis aurantiaca]|uniref:Chaperonin 10-like protein n=1 Tax=Hygrophoropsis aurantiaca TaxID=72124 RepID=A0ACB8A088_9AGAM|nr:chaperonin 10-like protein [Hygrophoropsis aurantiaca]
MNALRFEKTGPLDNLTFSNVPRPTLTSGEALVLVKAAGINGSDSAGIQGWLPFVTTPRIAGRDFSGEVIEVAENSDASAQQWIGAEVWGTGSDRGFAADGTFAEYVKVPIEALSRKPQTLDHVKAGSITLPWLCAWIAVETLANVKQGDNIVIIGARGAIGSGAAQLCKDRGAKVFGTYRSLANIHPPSFLTPIELSSKTSIRDSVARHGLQNKIDVLLDCAGYEDPFNDAIFTMTPKGSGRVVVMAVHRSDGLFTLDLRTLYAKALTLKGLKSSILGPAEVKKVLDELAMKIDNGALEGPKEVKSVAMDDMDGVKGALTEVLTRSSSVRSVIVPST